MVTRAEIIRAEINEVVRELNVLDNVEGELDPRQARRRETFRAREVGLRAELVAEIAAQGNSSHSVGYFFLILLNIFALIHSFCSKNSILRRKAYIIL